MTDRRTFLKQTATLAALGTGWLTAEEAARPRAPDNPNGCIGRCPRPVPGHHQSGASRRRSGACIGRV